MKSAIMLTASLVFLLGVVLPAIASDIILPTVEPLQDGSPPPSGYEGLNLMFIIDQSGSMGGTRYSGDPKYGLGNDPQDLRFFIPQYAIDWLSSFLNALPDGSRPTINFSLVTFGTTSRPILQWINLEDDYLNASDAQKAQLLTDISNVRFFNAERNVYTSLGFTNFSEAFKEGDALFNNAPRSSGVGRPYLSAVIVLTDGAPCIPNEFCENFNPDGYPAGHLTNLATYIKSNYPNTELFVAGLDATDAFFSALEGYWRNIVCTTPSPEPPCDALRLQQVRTESEASTQFNDILSYLFDTVSAIDLASIILTPPDTFFVPPYTQLLRVGIFKSNNEPLGDVVVLTRPDGGFPTGSEMTEIGINTLIEAREVSLPQAGEWKIDITDVSRVESVNYRANLINASAEMSISGIVYQGTDTAALVASPPSLPLNAYQTVPVQLRVINGTSGATLVEDPAYPLTVVAYLYDATEPDPANRTLVAAPITLSPDPNFAGTTVFTGNWIPISGKYEVRIDATYIHPTEGVKPLLDRVTVYDGIEVGAVDFVPAGLATTSYLQGEPILLSSSAIYHATGTPVSYPMPGLETQVTAVDQSGAVVLDQAIPNTATDAGEIEAQLTLDTPSQYSVTTQLMYRDEAGNLQPVNALPNTYHVTIRPIQELTVSVSLNPSEKSVDAHSFGFSTSFPFVGEINPVLVVVQVKNEHTGQPASLADISDGTVTVPILTLRHGDTTRDLSDQLSEGQAGVYTTELDDLGLGDYTIAAIANVPEDQLAADLTWRTSSATIQQERNLAPFFYILGAGFGLLVLTTFGSMATVRQVIVYRGNLPKMQGTVLIQYLEYGKDLRDAETIRPWDVTGRNKFTVKGRDANPFSLIRFVAPDKKQSLNGVVIVERAEVNKKNVLKTRIRLIEDGNPVKLWASQEGIYYAMKEVKQVGFGETRFDQKNDE